MFNTKRDFFENGEYGFIVKVKGGLMMADSINQESGSILYQEQIELMPSHHSDHAEAFRIHYRSDGLKVVGFIVKPKEMKEKAPLLIYNRGGAEDRTLINSTLLSTFFSFLARKGYVVLASQYRGNDGGEGEDRWGGDDIHDVLNLVEVAKQLPYVDTDRKVMIGQSRGGLMTYLAIRKQLDLKAAVVVSGPTDLTDLYQKRGENMKEILMRLVGDPNLNTDEYMKRSPINWADEINAPLLIIHGGNDWMSPVQQVRDFARKLDELNKDYRYVEYPDGDHFLKGKWDEVKKEIIHFFHDRLK
ncbi:alpha/beta hydrolase family protein [Paenibacillus tarimensis]